MADITVTDITMAGVTVTLGNAAASDTIPIANVDDRVFLLVTNGSGGSIDVTITRQETAIVVPGAGAVTLTDRVIAVGAGASKVVGPFTRSDIDPETRKVELAWSATSSVTRGAFRLPAAA